MQTVIISSKYQIVIPKKVREALHLLPGEKLHLVCYQNCREVIPVKDVKKMRGSLKEIKTVIKRDKDRL